MALGLLILRLCVGLTMAAHGGQKLFGWFGGNGLDATSTAMETHFGFKPGRLHATMAGASELAGGALLVLGFLTPFAAAMVVGVMIVAAATAHAGKGFFLTAGGFEYNLVLAVAALTLAFTGPGTISIDHLLYGGALSGVAWGIAALILGAVAAVATLSGREQADRQPALTDEREPVEREPVAGESVVAPAGSTTVIMDRSTDDRSVESRAAADAARAAVRGPGSTT